MLLTWHQLQPRRRPWHRNKSSVTRCSTKNKMRPCDELFVILKTFLYCDACQGLHFLKKFTRLNGIVTTCRRSSSTASSTISDWRALVMSSAGIFFKYGSGANALNTDTASRPSTWLLSRRISAGAGTDSNRVSARFGFSVTRTRKPCLEKNCRKESCDFPETSTTMILGLSEVFSSASFVLETCLTFFFYYSCWRNMIRSNWVSKN